MAYDFSPLRNRLEETKEWLKVELSGIRTGRAAPALLDSVMVDAYGSRMPLRQVASVSVEDARTLRVSPFDASTTPAIEKAITDASLGVSIGSDERGVRVSFPELTAERRQTLIKLANDKLEDARISVRKERDEIWNDIQKRAKEGDISEDEKFRYKEEMQKIVDEGTKELEETAARKEKEIKE